MKKLSLLMTKPGIVFFSVFAALTLIFLSFLRFRMQVNIYIEEDMHAQVEAIQKNSAQLIESEMNHLKRLTASAAQIVSRAELQTDEDILQLLEDYAETSNVVRALFITLDGHAYTSYAGYLGQSESNISIDGSPLSEIKEPIFSQPYYAEDLNELVFGVLAPASMGDKQGVLISSYNIRGFSKLLENGLIGGSAEIGIINNRGEVVIGQQVEEFQLDIFDALGGVEFETSSVETMRTDFANGRSGFSIYRVEGMARYSFYAPIGLNDWYVIVMVKESALRSKLSNLEQYGFQLTVELVVVMLSLLTIIMTNRLLEQKKIRMLLEQAALLDGLTGILNRKAMEDAIEQSLYSAKEGSGVALLVIDVDDFKKINDQGGHLLGDHVLKECAARLKAAFGAEAVVGRIGGDEFAVFLPEGGDAEAIRKKTDEIIRDFTVSINDAQMLRVSISVGIAQACAKADSFLTLYQTADDALYRAKQGGKGRLSS